MQSSPTPHLAVHIAPYQPQVLCCPVMYLSWAPQPVRPCLQLLVKALLWPHSSCGQSWGHSDEMLVFLLFFFFFFLSPYFPVRNHQRCLRFPGEVGISQADEWGLCPQGVRSHGLLCGAVGPRGVLLTSEEGFSLRREQRVLGASCDFTHR